MPCDAKASQTQRQQALRRLEQQLKDKAAKLVNVNGRVSIRGWEGDRAGFCDDCAMTQLQTSQDFRVRLMVTEALKGGQQSVHSH